MKEEALLITVINQKVLERQLKMHNFVVTIANHGKEALDILEAERDNAARDPNWNPISLVLLDIMMPVMGGEECVREIRAREKSGELSKKYVRLQLA